MGMQNASSLEEPAMNCPRCQTEMGVIRFPKLGGAEVGICPGCEGSWYPQDVLSSVMFKTDRSELETTELAPTLDLDKTHVDLEAAVDCPTCGQQMHRFRYALAPNVEIDECAEHGVWLDDGELGIMLDQLLFQGETLSEKRARLEAEREGAGLKPIAKGAISPVGLTLRALNALHPSSEE